jgi:hypothetical protein
MPPSVLVMTADGGIEPLDTGGDYEVPSRLPAPMGATRSRSVSPSLGKADAEALSLRAPEASALGLSHERVPRVLALTLGDALGERDGAPEADTEREGAAEREPLTV